MLGDAWDKVKGWLEQSLQFIVDKLTWIIDSLYIVLTWFLDALIYALKAVMYLFLDGILLSVKAFITTIDFSAVALQFAAGHGLLPPAAAYFMCAIGFPQFVTMIAAAYVIRVTLNLIPSWATRA